MPENKNVILEVQDLKMKFGKLEVLKGVTTTIRRGEVIVVIGASVVLAGLGQIPAGRMRGHHQRLSDSLLYILLL